MNIYWIGKGEEEEKMLLECDDTHITLYNECGACVLQLDIRDLEDVQKSRIVWWTKTLMVRAQRNSWSYFFTLYMVQKFWDRWYKKAQISSL